MCLTLPETGLAQVLGTQWLQLAETCQKPGHDVNTLYRHKCKHDDDPLLLSLGVVNSGYSFDLPCNPKLWADCTSCSTSAASSKQASEPSAEAASSALSAESESPAAMRRCRRADQQLCKGTLPGSESCS